jgi:two-component system, response regulator PdtaR
MTQQPMSETEEAKQPKSVLVVEDNGPLRFTLCEWLRSLNYNVVEATSADDAVMILESAIIIDFVVTDIQMPGKMDGLDLVRYINSSLPGLNVIAVSGGDFHILVKEEGTQFFKKPYDLEIISSHIAKILADSDSESGGFK